MLIPRSFLIVVIISALQIWSIPVIAQTKEQGPWWPHPVWGAGDQAGGSNWITPTKVLDAIKMVKSGTVYELGHKYSRSMPLLGERNYSMFIPGAPTGGPFGKNNLVFHEEILITEIGQVGTQFDGPGHIGTRVKMADGTEKDVFYNGHFLEDFKGSYGLQKLGVEHIKPIITRGILIDIASAKGVEVLPNSYEVTLKDVREALKKQSVSEDSIKPGDALFFRVGWSKYWNDHEKYNSFPAGIGMEVARWVVEKQASMVGADNWPTEVMPSPEEGMLNPVHQELIVKNGIWNMENMIFDSLVKDGVSEFLFMFAPTPFEGATGSPGRPIGIR